MGRWHARYAMASGAQVVAIVDPDPLAANRLRATFPEAGAFADLTSMLAAVTPDVVHICTPAQTHRALVAVALEQKVHVMIEKPVAADAEEARLLLDMADAAGMVLCPVYQFPFQYGFQQAQQWLRSRGPLLRIDLTICSAGAERLGLAASELLVREILPHPVSALCMLTGQHTVDYSGWSVAGAGEGEFFASGRVAGVEASICISTHARPPRAEARVFCAEGTVQLDFFHGFSIVQQARGGRIGKVMLPFDAAAGSLAGAARNLLRRALAHEPAYPGLKKLIAAFFAAAKHQGPPPFSRALIETVADWCDHLGADRRT